jgi:hypothetical protein
MYLERMQYQAVSVNKSGKEENKKSSNAAYKSTRERS